MTTARTTLALVALLFSAWASAAAADQRSFASPQEGFAALADAVKAGDLKALEAMLGPEGHSIIHSGDPVADENARKAFVEAYATRNTVTPLDDAHSALAIGSDGWEFPIPLAKTGNAWRFDVVVGKQELLNRRIGRNELAAIKASLAYVDAQREFAARSGGAYAQRVVSSPGHRDGLYWPARSGEAQSPLGPLFAEAEAKGYTIPTGAQPSAPAPYYGYLYRILTTQGPAANGGKRNYVVNGRMTGGFALVATPVAYGASGVMTFIVNQDGKVFQKDLGANTAASAAAITTFNPDKGWSAGQ